MCLSHYANLTLIMRYRVNRFCLGQVVFDPDEKSIVIYGGKIDNGRTSCQYFALDGTRIYEMVGYKQYLPFKTVSGEIFVGHFARIMELEKAFSGALNAPHFDDTIWGLINHTIKFIGKPYAPNIKDDHVLIEKLPGEY